MPRHDGLPAQRASSQASDLVGTAAAGLLLAAAEHRLCHHQLVGSLDCPLLSLTSPRHAKPNSAASSEQHRDHF